MESSKEWSSIYFLISRLRRADVFLAICSESQPPANAMILSSCPPQLVVIYKKFPTFQAGASAFVNESRHLPHSQTLKCKKNSIFGKSCLSAQLQASRHLRRLAQDSYTKFLSSSETISAIFLSRNDKDSCHSDWLKNHLMNYQSSEGIDQTSRMDCLSGVRGGCIYHRDRALWQPS
jgi:hypothetical protein